MATNMAASCTILESINKEKLTHKHIYYVQFLLFAWKTVHILKAYSLLISNKEKIAIKIQNGHQYGCQLYDFNFDLIMNITFST